MKTFILKLLSYVILLVIIFICITKIKDLNNQLSNSINNIKAYAIENSNLKESNRVFKMTIDQIKCSNDSLMNKMKQIANENGIKDRKIKALQYQLENFKKIDTIKLTDTIFRYQNFVLDTCLQDKWNKTCLHMEYPNLISINNEYKNEKYLIVDSHKEPIKPRKWFLPKLFTKKQTVLEITVIDENPYVITEKQRFVEIIK